MCGLLGRIVGDAGVDGLAGADGLVEGGQGFFEGGVRIKAMRVENIHIVELHAAQGGVQTGQEVLAAAPFAVGAGPHAVAGLGGDDQLVAVAGQVGGQDRAEGFLGRAGLGAVVVGQVKVRDAGVEGGADHRAGVVEGIDGAEVVPQAQRDRGQQQAAVAAAVVGELFVTVGGGHIGHIGILSSEFIRIPAFAGMHDNKILNTKH